MTTVLSIFVGGGTGAVLRWFLSSKIGGHWGIFTVNVLGAFLIGLAVGYFSHKTDIRPELRSFVITGFLGGFTTFSTYLLDFSNLVGAGKTGEAFLYLTGSVMIGLAALLAGMQAV